MNSSTENRILEKQERLAAEDNDGLDTEGSRDKPSASSSKEQLSSNSAEPLSVISDTSKDKVLKEQEHVAAESNDGSDTEGSLDEPSTSNTKDLQPSNYAELLTAISNICEDEDLKEHAYKEANDGSDTEGSLDESSTASSIEVLPSPAELLSESKSVTSNISEDKVLKEQEHVAGGANDDSGTEGSLDEPSTSSSKEKLSSNSAELLEECKTFVSNISDPVKFSYAGLCATTLHVLYGTKRDRDYRHHFLTSFVTHLSLTSNVRNTMHAISDGQALGDCSQQFLKDVLQDENIKSNKKMLVQDLVSWAVVSSNGRYDSRSRILIRHISWQLPIQLEVLEEIEKELLEMLSERTEEEKIHRQERQKSEKRQKFKRYALIGLATAGGGALIGLTGGLAAPLVAAGAGAILGGASAAALSSVAGIAIITSLFGAAGAGLTGYKMKRRVGGIDEFEFQQITASNQLAITIAISGWLSEDSKNNFFFPWKDMHQSSEQYTLMWESEHLKRLGKAFEYILDSLVSFAATEALKYTALAGIITAVAWPASLISVAGVIDNPWSVCLQRSAQVGRQLAEVLIAREHGQRPVTLIGFSLGAKVIFHCLHHLAKKKNHSGIIEDVFIIGAPVSGKPEDWEGLSSVVAGHITNGYCRSDWLLRFLYRTSSRQHSVAGLQPVEWENRRMINMDLSSIVTGHLDYVKNINTVLAAVGVRTKEAMKRPTGCLLLKSKDD